jgi:hypothetical protein
VLQALDTLKIYATPVREGNDNAQAADVAQSGSRHGINAIDHHADIHPKKIVTLPTSDRDRPLPR